MIEVVGKDLNAFSERIFPFRMVRQSTDSIPTIEQKPCGVLARVAERPGYHYRVSGLFRHGFFLPFVTSPRGRISLAGTDKSVPFRANAPQKAEVVTQPRQSSVAGCGAAPST